MASVYVEVNKSQEELPGVADVQAESPLSSTGGATPTILIDFTVAEAEVDDGNSGNSKTIDWSAGFFHKLTVTGSPAVLTFSNPSAGKRYLLKCIQGSGGTKTITWPASVKWPAGTAPTLSTTAGKVDIMQFYYDGTNFYGSSALDLR